MTDDDDRRPTTDHRSCLWSSVVGGWSSVVKICRQQQHIFVLGRDTQKLAQHTV